MAKLQFDQAGQRFYENGVDHCVLFVQDTDGTYAKGVAWNGITSISESPEGGEISAVYADNIKYLNLVSAEELKLTVEAYTYPDEFMDCDGSATVVKGMTFGQQARKHFAMAYRTKIGNDETAEKGYKLHVIYGCVASPSERQYQTINDSPEAIAFSWSISTTPETASITKDDVTTDYATSHVIMDSTDIAPATLKYFEDMIYGTASEDSELPSLQDIVDKVFAA